jgi:hypothetical protein
MKKNYIQMNDIYAFVMFHCVAPLKITTGNLLVDFVYLVVKHPKILAILSLCQPQLIN